VQTLVYSMVSRSVIAGSTETIPSPGG
jgi:hypothetical protein